jgi:hypothetical protein
LEQDKSGIGVSRTLKPILETLAEKYFETQDAAFMACVTLAIARKLPITETGPVERTWHAGGNRQELLDFIEWYLTSPNPVRTMEELGHAGLLYVGEKLAADAPFEEIFRPA